MEEKQSQIMDQVMVDYDQEKKRKVKTYYTIGILLSKSFIEVLLIGKIKPEWQRGKFNFPGGHLEPGEHPADCVSREFKEETNLDIPSKDWKYIGEIENLTGKEYSVAIYTSIYDPELHGKLRGLTQELPLWFLVDGIHDVYNMISNIPWLTHFAINCHKQGNKDKLLFGKFTYED